MSIYMFPSEKKYNKKGGKSKPINKTKKKRLIHAFVDLMRCNLKLYTVCFVLRVILAQNALSSSKTKVSLRSRSIWPTLALPTIRSSLKASNCENMARTVP